MSLYNFFAEIPWYIPAATLIAGIVLFYTGNNRMDKAMKRIGIVCALVAAALSIVSWVMVSDREAVTISTRGMVRAVEGRKWEQLTGYFHPKAELRPFFGRDAIVAACQTGVEGIELKSVSVTGLTVRKTEEGFTVGLQVYSEADTTGSQLTNWEIDWEKFDGKWQITEIRPLGGAGISVDAIQNWLHRRL